MNLVRKGRISEPVLDYAMFMAKINNPGYATIEPLQVKGREYHLLYLQDHAEALLARLAKMFVIACIPAPFASGYKIITEYVYIRERSLPEDDALRRSIYPVITDKEWTNHLQSDQNLLRRAKDRNVFLSVAFELT